MMEKRHKHVHAIVTDTAAYCLGSGDCPISIDRFTVGAIMQELILGANVSLVMSKDGLTVDTIKSNLKR